MKASFVPRLLLLTFLLSAATGCAAIKKDAERAKADRESVTDPETLSQYLRRNGVSLMYDGPFTSPYMTVPGQSFTVMSGGQLYIFQYNSESDALGAHQWVRQTWPERPDMIQMYRKEKMIAVYIGDDPRATRVLLRVMGSQTM